jgi:hypothetical protein
VNNMHIISQVKHLDPVKIIYVKLLRKELINELILVKHNHNQMKKQPK